jgi:hypothetical protein
MQIVAKTISNLPQLKPVEVKRCLSEQSGEVIARTVARLMAA